MAKNRRIRIAHVINQLGPAGAERSLVDLIPYLQRADIDPVVVCVRPIAPAWAHDAELPCQVKVLRGRSFARRILDLQATLVKGRFDLIHTTLFDADVMGRVTGAAVRVPVLTSLVNTTYESARLADPNIRRRRLMAVHQVDKWTARLLTHHFHAVSGAVRDSAVRTLGIDPSRITVIHRGRDPQRFPRRTPERRAAARHRLGLMESDQVIINVARQEYQKGQRFLIEAVAILADEHPRLRVIIAGREGHGSGELAELTRQQGVVDRVRFLGSRSDVPDLLPAADIFAFPSLYEGLGGAVLEAMATGLPVVASDVPALREVVEPGRSGLLVAPADPRQLSEALARLLTNPGEADALGLQGRRLFLDRFTLDLTASLMVELYIRLAA